jgi:hypothetical protein
VSTRHARSRDGLPGPLLPQPPPSKISLFQASNGLRTPSDLASHANLLLHRPYPTGPQEVCRPPAYASYSPSRDRHATSGSAKMVSTLPFPDALLLTIFLTSIDTARVRAVATLSLTRAKADIQSSSQLSADQARVPTLRRKTRRTSIESSHART